LRAQGGETVYRSDFISQYLLPVLYPEDLTRDLQLLLGTGVVILNSAVYWWLWHTQSRGASRYR
jgi:type II secretory pathway component PulM